MERFKNISLNIGHFIIFAIVFVLMISAASYVPIYGAISLLLLFPLYSSRHHINKTAIIILTYTSLILLSLAIFIVVSNVFVNIEVLDIKYSLNSNIKDINMILAGKGWNEDNFIIKNVDLIANVLRDSTKIVTDIFKYIISFIIGLMGSIIWFIALIWSVKK